MADLSKLDPEIRAAALVGQFLQAWSAMELALHDAIGAALGVEKIKVQILCANIQFRDKTNIMRTLVDVAPFSDDEKQTAKATLRKLGESAAYLRNMIAHSPFKADATKTGVEFITVKAKGAFDTPGVVWSETQFQEEDKILEGYSSFLGTLKDRFKQTPIRDYTSALLPFVQTDWPVPMRRPMSSALYNFQSQPPPMPLDSDQATPETSPQKPDKPEE